MTKNRVPSDKTNVEGYFSFNLILLIYAKFEVSKINNLKNESKNSLLILNFNIHKNISNNFFIIFKH